MIDTNRNVPAVFLVLSAAFALFAYHSLWFMWASGFFGALFGITAMGELFWEKVRWE